MKIYCLIGLLAVFFSSCLPQHPHPTPSAIDKTNGEGSISPEGTFHSQSKKNGTEPVSMNEVKLDLLYIPQKPNTCAATCVAMAISYYEQLKENPLHEETIWKLSGTDKATVARAGNDMEGLNRIAIHYGYKSEYIEHMEFSDVERFLAHGIPVMLNVKSKQSSATHAILVIGYDKQKEIFYINDPAQSQYKIVKYSDLESQWSAHLSSPWKTSYRSGFVVYPKNHDYGTFPVQEKEPPTISPKSTFHCSCQTCSVYKTCGCGCGS